MTFTVPRRAVRTVILQDASELPAVVSAVEQAAKNADHTDAMHQMAGALVQDHAGYFAQAKAPDGTPWAPLSPVTIAAKGHGTILVDTTVMRASLTSGGPGHIEAVTPNSLTWGTSDEKAPLHMTGTSRMPARPMVGVAEQRADDFANLIADVTVELMK